MSTAVATSAEEVSEASDRRESSAAAASTRVVSSEAIFRIARRGRVDSLDLAELASVIDIDNDEDDFNDANTEQQQQQQAIPGNVTAPAPAAFCNGNNDGINGNNNDNSSDNVMFGSWNSSDPNHLLICPRRQLNSPDISARLTNWTTLTTTTTTETSKTAIPTIQELFETFFPKDWMRQVLLVQTNQQLIENASNTTVNDNNNSANNNAVEMISYGEMLRFLGLWFLMATTHFEDMNDFWMTTTTTTKSTEASGNGDSSIPFMTTLLRLDPFMSHERFYQILNALQYTNTDHDDNVEHDNVNDDAFWQVRQMLQAWNDNMSTQFMASWISCLDITMSPWIVPTAGHDKNSSSNNDERYEYSLCPGFKCVPRMQFGPLLLGNKYHVICCAKTGILYRMELDEGRDAAPTISASKEFSDSGNNNNKTIGTWLRLAKPLFGSAKVVMLGRNMMSSSRTASGGGSCDSCLVEGLMELKKRGVFGTALIQQRQSSSSPSSSSTNSSSSWPKHICGNDIMLHFADKDVGHADSLPGTFRGQSFHVACIKERPFGNHRHHHDDNNHSPCSICSSNVTMLLSTYGTMERGGETKTRHYHDEQNGITTKRTKSFQYPQVIQNHIQYHDTVDWHNVARMQPISLEAETWKKATTRWPNRVFQFLLAVTEVNCRLAMENIFCENNNINNGQEKKKTKYSQQEFRKLLAKSLIYNTHLAAAAETNHRNNNHHEQQQQHQSRVDDEDTSISIQQERISAETATAAAAITASTATTAAATCTSVHRLVQIPRYRTFRGENLVKVKTRYAQRLCQCKRSRLRSYCQCTPGVYLCTQCFAEHITATMHNINDNNSSSSQNNSDSLS